MSAKLQTYKIIRGIIYLEHLVQTEVLSSQKHTYEFTIYIFLTYLMGIV